MWWLMRWTAAELISLLTRGGSAAELLGWLVRWGAAELLGWLVRLWTTEELFGWLVWVGRVEVRSVVVIGRGRVRWQVVGVGVFDHCAVWEWWFQCFLLWDGGRCSWWS
jgi:hypothetical protein